MVMEGVDQQLKRHAGVVDQRLRLVRRTQRALREAQRLHQAVDAIEGEQRRQVAQGAQGFAGRHLAAVVERTEHQRFGADGLGLFQQRFGQLPHLFATTVKGVDRVNRQDLDVVARRQLAHLLMAQIVGHFSAG